MSRLIKVFGTTHFEGFLGSTKGGPVQTGFLNGNAKLADKTSMVSAGSWRDHFKIDDNILKSFWGDFSQSSPLRASELTESSAASSLEFVLWCIREGHFSEEAFLRFQSKAFEIPVVSPSFFESPVDRDFWDRVKDVHPWTSDCVPLTEWDGFLLIASVWPQQSIKASLRHRLVLATPTQLREFHKTLQTSASASVATPPKSTPVAASPVITPPPPMTPPPMTPPPMTPPVMSAPTVTAPKAESQETDNGDPFAALSRSLGLTTDSDHDASAHATSSDELNSDEAPAGLVMPEGLSFSSDELSRLSQQDEGLVAPARDLTPIPEPIAPKVVATPEPPKAVVAPEPKVVLAPEPPPKVIATPAPPKAVATPPPVVVPPAPVAVTPEAKVVVPEPPPVVKPQAKAPPPPPPTMPFSPVVTPDAPAMVKPTAPKAPPPPPVVKAEPETSAPTRPPAEATVVVSASTEPASAPVTQTPKEPIEAPKTRRPLFEPSSSEKSPATASIPKAVSGGAASPTASTTQTGTGARARRLEATPLTSFFGAGSIAPNPVNAKSALRSNPGNSKYSGHVISLNKVEPVHLDQCTNVDDAGAQALLQACNIFETGMILLFKDGALQPWKWTDLMLSVKGDKPDDIDLHEPSIFKVVFRTAKPYHGYVVTSAVNQKFFNEFYRGLLPKHATVIPIMIDGRMGGMILGLTNMKLDYRQSLRLMERLGFDLARVFKMLRGAVAKAS